MRSAVIDAGSQPIRNQVKSTVSRGKAAIAYGTGALTVTPNVSVAGPDGTTTATRASWSTSASGFGVSFIDTYGVPNVYPNQVATVSCWVYVEAVDGGTLNLGVAISGYLAGPSVNVSVGKWTRVSATFPASDNTNRYVGVRAASAAANVSMLVTNMMVTQGATLYDFADALTPGWSALPDGTSAGYPYTLGRVLGGRAFYTTEALNTLVPVTDPGALTSRALYAVYDADGSKSGAYPNIAKYGSTNSGVLQIQTAGSGASATQARADLNSGSYNAYTNVDTAGRTQGRHIGSARVDSGLTRLITRGQGATTTSTATLTPGTGFQPSSQGFTLLGSSGDITPVAAVLVFGDIPDALDLAVQRWLANHYGVPLTA